jgi:hypothetical protein
VHFECQNAHEEIRGFLQLSLGLLNRRWCAFHIHSLLLPIIVPRIAHAASNPRTSCGAPFAINHGGATMRLTTYVTAALAVLALAAATAQEPQDRATIQLRDGTKVEGRIEALGKGSLFLRVSLADQRTIPIGSIALIDRKGGASGLPDTEVREARGADHLLLLTGGSSAKGQLVQIRGGEGSGDEGPRLYIFRTSDGQERSYPPDQIARIYLGAYPFEAGVAARPAEAVPAYVPPGGVRVPAAAGWVSTGITVRKGDLVFFQTSGEVQLSDNGGDRARAPGTSRMAQGAPLPSVNAGALIGRIGPRGMPFGIGDQASVPMPGDGTLFLAVNDDDRSDNAGEFVVVASRNPR